ncbi:MAG: hypothetical protein JWO36_3080 [Myxococcales bacterium]|nr:hypothetical protein [Myxococcales bacterium]
MAAVRQLALVMLCGCGDLQGFSGPVPPVVSFHVEVTGDLAAFRPPTDAGPANLHVALVWGRQWLVEPLCILPPENADAAALIAAGCRDPLGFVPARVAANVAVEPNVPTQLDLFTLPAADVMVGDLTARVAYGSLVVYDDLDHSGKLELARPNRPDRGPPMQGDISTTVNDRVYGASFITMTMADQRVAFREGAFSAVAAFYPRAGCGDPPPGFSVLAAGGFSFAEALKATQENRLPMEDPATCVQQAPADASFTIPLQSPSPPAMRELACTERATDASVRYREPDPAEDPPDFTNRVMACVHSPSFGTPSDVVELIVSGRSDDSCIGLTHYVLKGCSESPTCGSPDWDHSLAPPTWWPCP